MQVYVCCECGSKNIYRDAYVNVNTSEVIETNVVNCDDCGTENIGVDVIDMEVV